MEKVDDINHADFEPFTLRSFHFNNKSDLDDLVRDLRLLKRNAELLGSKLQKWYLLFSVMIKRN
jgi:hypothetical protein